MDSRLNELTATEIAAAVRAGDTSCEAVTRACLERIAEREPDVKAWRYLDADKAIAEAKLRDSGDRNLPFIGVPFNVKDIIDTADMPTEYGSPIYAGHRPAADAACVALGRKAGGVLLGKAVTTEFANFHPSATKNPLDLSRTPGGSSSGSAASVADCMAAVSVGSQTSGSTVRPSSYCGVFGYRPTFGDLSCVGIKESVRSFDTLGLVARSVEDISLFRDVLMDVAPAPVASLPSGPRIGFCRTALWDLLEPSTQTLFEDAAKALGRAGAAVFDLDLPHECKDLPAAHRVISGWEFSRSYAWEINNHWEKISTTLREGRVGDGLACSHEQYACARDLAMRCRVEFPRMEADFDVILTACATGEAPVGLHTTGNARLALTWTALYLPAVSVPVFRGPNGMPIGAYLVGKHGKDRELFAHARWIHQALR